MILILGMAGLLAAQWVWASICTYKFIRFLSRADRSDDFAAKVIPLPDRSTFRNNILFIFTLLTLFWSISVASCGSLVASLTILIASAFICFIAIGWGQWSQVKRNLRFQSELRAQSSQISEMSLRRARLEPAKGFRYWLWHQRQARLDNGKAVWVMYSETPDASIEGYVFEFRASSASFLTAKLSDRFIASEDYNLQATSKFSA